MIGLNFTRESQALVSTFVVSDFPAALTLLEGFNDSTSTVYVQAWDLSAPPPATTPEPVFVQRVPPGGSYSWAPGAPRNFLSGITIVASSTPNVYTPIGGASIWVDAEGYTL